MQLPTKEQILLLSSGLTSSTKMTTLLLSSSSQDGIKMITPFQHKVYTALCMVPAGKVTTYKYLAEAIQCKSTQAIGQALKRNPYAPFIPCHRVIKTNYELGGFHGHTSGTEIQRKYELLQKEGILFRKTIVSSSTKKETLKNPSKSKFRINTKTTKTDDIKTTSTTTILPQENPEDMTNFILTVDESCIFTF